MDKLAKEYIIDFFSKKLSLFGNVPAAVGWSGTGFATLLQNQLS